MRKSSPYNRIMKKVPYTTELDFPWLGKKIKFEVKERVVDKGFSVFADGKHYFNILDKMVTIVKGEEVKYYRLSYYLYNEQKDRLIYGGQWSFFDTVYQIEDLLTKAVESEKFPELTEMIFRLYNIVEKVTNEKK